MLTVCKNDLSGKSHSGNQLTPSCFRPTRTNNFLQLERDTDPSDACFMQEIFTEYSQAESSSTLKKMYWKEKPIYSFVSRLRF